MEKKFFNFKSEENFDLDSEYAKIFNEESKSINPDENKLKDAENIIATIGSKYLEYTSIRSYEHSFVNLNEFLVKFRVDSEDVKNMSTDDRDKLFAYGRELFVYYQEQYKNLQFNFELSLKEWNFIDHTLTKKLLYNGQELFNFWELFKQFIEPTRVIANEMYKQKIESFTSICSIQSLVLLSHLLMKHEEKGSTESFHSFRTVLMEVAQMTKLFNAYGVILERIVNRYDNWVNALNAMDGYNSDDRSN